MRPVCASCRSSSCSTPNPSSPDERPTNDPAAGRCASPVREVELEIERPDGSRIVVQVHIEPIRDATGRVVGAVNSFLDVTPASDARQAARDLAPAACA